MDVFIHDSFMDFLPENKPWSEERKKIRGKREKRKNFPWKDYTNKLSLY